MQYYHAMYTSNVIHQFLAIEIYYRNPSILFASLQLKFIISQLICMYIKIWKLTS
jgi:hypothetical protein